MGPCAIALWKKLQRTIISIVTTTINILLVLIHSTLDMEVVSIEELMTSLLQIFFGKSFHWHQHLIKVLSDSFLLSFDFDYLNFNCLQREKQGRILLTSSHLLLFKRLRCQEFYETLLSNDSGVEEPMHLTLTVKGILCCPSCCDISSVICLRQRLTL